jgi:CheY-like chemotaxis protein
MIFQLCPACQHVIPPGAARCGACGASLDAGDTIRDTLALSERPTEPGRLEPESGALWLDELELPPDSEAPTLSDDAPLNITLREIATPPAPPASDFGRPRGKATASSLPAEELLVSDPEPPFPPGSEERERSSIRALLATDGAARAAAKAAKRKAVRRARIGSAASQDAETPAVPHVLVLDADDGARASLCTLLEGFGFRVLPVIDVERAMMLADGHRFVAAFVDVVLDGTDGGGGVELCALLKSHSPPPGGAHMALVLVRAQLQPMERVRAKLAGCDAFLVKPVARGDVARALEACSVRLPADARHT